MNEEFISVLTYLTEFVLSLSKPFVSEVILVETNRRIKSPDLDFGKIPPVHWNLAFYDIKPWHKPGGVF